MTKGCALPSNAYERLSWHNRDPDRDAAIRDLLADPGAIDLARLLQPFGRKDVWEASALVLRALGVPALTRHLPALLRWLQDMNWPGALIVRDMLAQAGPDLIGDALDAARDEARRTRDPDWMDSLDDLRQRLANKP